MVDEQELNRKIAEWCGLHFYPECECIRNAGICWGVSAETYGKNGHWHFVLPHFTKSLDACFEYIVPKLQKTGTGYCIEFIYNATERDTKRFECVLLHEYLAVNTYFAGSNKVNIYYYDKTPALALCRAVEKLIQGEEDASNR